MQRECQGRLAAVRTAGRSLCRAPVGATRRAWATQARVLRVDAFWFTQSGDVSRYER